MYEPWNFRFPISSVIGRSDVFPCSSSCSSPSSGEYPVTGTTHNHDKGREADTEKETGDIISIATTIPKDGHAAMYG